MYKNGPRHQTALVSSKTWRFWCLSKISWQDHYFSRELLLFYAGAVGDPQESSDPAEAGFMWPKPGFFRPLAWLLGLAAQWNSRWITIAINGRFARLLGKHIYTYIYIHTYTYIMLYCTCNIHIWLKYTHLTVTGASKNALGQCCKDRTWLNPHSHPLTFMNIHQLYIYIYI